MIDAHQIAHDLAMVYVHNRHGAEVTGESDEDSGYVETERLPDVDAKVMESVPTGEKWFFGRFDKTELVDSGKYEVDDVFLRMIRDYRAAYARFLALLDDT